MPNYNSTLQTNNSSLEEIITQLNNMPDAGTGNVDLSNYVTVDQLDEKADADHTHDDKYYTESEVDNKLASKADTSHNHSATNITSGTLSIARGGTGYTAIADTTYTTARYRASALVSSTTNPTTNGVINWIYE